MSIPYNSLQLNQSKKINLDKKQINLKTNYTNQQLKKSQKELNKSEHKQLQKPQEQYDQFQQKIKIIEPLNQSQLINEATWNVVGNGISTQLLNLRRTNLITIMSNKNSQNRTDKQNRIIQDILKYEPFFQTIVSNYKLFSQIVSKLQYKYFKEQQTIYNVNEPTQGYFILIRGQVHLSIPQKLIPKIHVETQDQKLLKQIQKNNKNKANTKANTKKTVKDKCSEKNKLQNGQNKIEPKSPIKQQKSSAKNIQANDLRQNSINLHQSQSHDDNPFQNYWSPTQPHLQQFYKQSPNNKINQQNLLWQDKIVKVVQQGECFGEISVGQMNRRATNAKARYDSHLIMIKKQHYDLISKASLTTEMKRRHQFLRELALFKKVYRYSIEGFIYYLSEVPCQYKSILYKEGQQIKYVYIIKSGEFTQSKRIQPNSKATHKINQKNYQNDQFNKLRNHQENWRQAVFKNIYGGQIIGDAEVFMNKQTYNQSCKCLTQSGTVYKIQKSIFLQKLLAPENQVNAIQYFLSKKYKNKHKSTQLFLQNQIKNSVISRMLPASMSCDRKLKKKISLNQSLLSLKRSKNSINDDLLIQKQQFGQKMHFFEDFNRTIRKSDQNLKIGAKSILNKQTIQCERQGYTKQKGRSKSVLLQSKSRVNQSGRKYIKRPLSFSQSPKIKHNKSLKQKQQPIRQKQDIETPSNIKDIVELVKSKEKYFTRRNMSKFDDLSFSFEKPKLPRFIQQKFKYLIERVRKSK